MFVKHLPRMLSNWEAQICDRLSCGKTTLIADKQLVNCFAHLEIPFQLSEWLKSPDKDWSLRGTILEVV